MKKPKKWSEKDNSRASAEQGWAIFECQGSQYAPEEGPDLRICRVDTVGAFDSDGDAMRFVVHTALSEDGSNELAVRALTYLKKKQPAHWHDVVVKRLGCLNEQGKPVSAFNPCHECERAAAFAHEGRCAECHYGTEHPDCLCTKGQVKAQPVR